MKGGVVDRILGYIHEGAFLGLAIGSVTPSCQLRPLVQPFSVRRGVR